MPLPIQLQMQMHLKMHDESFGRGAKQQFHLISFESYIDAARGRCNCKDNVIGNLLIKLT
jgi:hypothetical protein